VSHIGNLGSQENICKAKLEICNGLPEGAPLVLNYDDKFLRAAKLPAHVRPVWFSMADESADVCALSIRQEKDGMSFVLEDQEEGTFVVKIPAMGKHNVANALAAYCAATRLGCDPRKVIQGLAAFEQTGRRQKVVDSKGVTVIEDCYNANPDSMKAALAMFKEFPCKRRFALLGDMLELGDLSREAHEELGRLAAESDLYCLVTYGEQAKRTAVVAAAKGQKTLHPMSTLYFEVPTKRTAKTAADEAKKPGKKTAAKKTTKAASAEKAVKKPGRKPKAAPEAPTEKDAKKPGRKTKAAEAPAEKPVKKPTRKAKAEPEPAAEEAPKKRGRKPKAAKE
jgi:UDP-N-acetylmuramyl pentapeptide synthase